MTPANDSFGPMTAIGLMSGTSMDGIDVALIRSDGVSMVDRGPFLSVPYTPAFRRRLAAALETALAIEARENRPGDLAEIERDLTDLHAAAVETATGAEVEAEAAAARNSVGVGLAPVTTGTDLAPWTPPDPEAIGVSRRQFFNRATIGLMAAGIGTFSAASFVAFLWPTKTGSVV